MSRFKASNCAGSIGLLTLPQAMCPSLEGSFTMNLSFGDRPVWAPVLQTNGPSAASLPSSRRMACSYKFRSRQVPVDGTGSSHARLFETVRSPRLSNRHFRDPQGLAAGTVTAAGDTPGRPRPPVTPA